MVLHDQYTESAFAAYNGDVTSLNDGAGTDIRVALLGAGHTPDLDAHSSFADVSGDDIANTTSNSEGYTEGGQILENMTWDKGNNAITFDGDNVTWADSTIDAGYAVIYDDTPTDDVDKTLLQLIDFEGEESSEDGDFTIDWDDAGIFEHTPRPA